MNTTRRWALLCLVSLGLSACAGDGIPEPVGPAPLCTDLVPFRPTLPCIQQFVFTPACAFVGCHANPGAQHNQDLSEGNAWASIVGVASMEVPGLNRVTPGDPNNSYLIKKLEGDFGVIVGAQMPDGGPYLSQAEIDVIRQWILDGAHEN